MDRALDKKQYEPSFFLFRPSVDSLSDGVHTCLIFYLRPTVAARRAAIMLARRWAHEGQPAGGKRDCDTPALAGAGCCCTGD